jgi:hypothetical protein
VADSSASRNASAGAKVMKEALPMSAADWARKTQLKRAERLAADQDDEEEAGSSEEESGNSDDDDCYGGPDNAFSLQQQLEDEGITADKDDRGFSPLEVSRCSWMFAGSYDHFSHYND